MWPSLLFMLPRTFIQANDYIWERGGSQYRAMLLNEVVMGRVIKLTEEDQNLTEVREMGFICAESAIIWAFEI